MYTIYLAGNSFNNKTWIEKVKSNFDAFSDGEILHYDHWQSGDKWINLQKESEKLVEFVKDKKDYFVFAKSIGSVLALKNIFEKTLTPKKLIICGFPYCAGKKAFEKIDECLRTLSIPAMFIQNEFDPVYSFEELEKTLKENKPADYQLIKNAGNNTHDYEDFEQLVNIVKNFMTNKTQDWQELSREEAFRKYSRKIEKVIFKLPNGKESDFYIKKEGPAASVLALTSDNQVIIAKQYRPGPKKVLMELPGGFVDPNEEPEVTMKRELLEETGYEGDVKLITTCLDDAYSTMERYCFVATNCKKVNEIENGEDEFTELVLVPLEEFKKILRSGQMTDVEVGFLGLDYLHLL